MQADSKQDSRKHKSKKRRHEDDSKHRKRKKRSVDGDNEDEWVEKEVEVSTQAIAKRDDWMLEPQSQTEASSSSSFFSSLGTEHARRDKPQLKPEPDFQKVSSKELNTSLLPNRSPSPPNAAGPTATPIHTPGGPGSQWRMTRLRRVYETAEEEGRAVDEVGVERFGTLEAFQAAQEERRVLDVRGSKMSSAEGSANRGRPETSERRFMFTAEPGSLSSSRSSSFKRPSNVHHPSSQPSTPTPPANRRVDCLRLPVSNAPSPLAQSHTPVSSVITPSLKQPTRSLSPSSLNRLQAKVIRAKLLGSPDADKLQQEYDEAAAAAVVQVEAIPTLDSRGRLYDIGSGKMKTGPENPAHGNRKKKEEKFQSHDPKTGEILRYNASDDRTTLADMIRHEKFGAGMNDQKNMDAEFAKAIMSDGKYQNDLDYMDDNALKLGREKVRSDIFKRQFAIGDFKKTQAIMASCPFCFPSETSSSGAALPKAPVIALGTRTYLSCTITEELVPGHCLIVPIQHHINMLEGDDDAWDEVKNFMKTLMKMYSEQDPGKGVLFYETVISLKKQKHTYIECVPVPWDVFDTLPGYFKESILTSETEWSTHKKLINFSSRPGGFRRSMVSNLPYFMVMFDHKGGNGYGHVIEGVDSNDKEDEEVGGLGEGEKGSGEFPWYFAGEIIGNVLDLEPRKWRRPRKVDFSRNKERVAKFREGGGYEKYDWTDMVEKS